MDVEKAIQFLVDHMAVLDSKLDAITAQMVTKRDLDEIKAILRSDQRFVTHSIAKTDTLISMLTESALRPEEMSAQQQYLLNRLQSRIDALEKRNPPQQAA